MCQSATAFELRAHGGMEGDALTEGLDLPIAIIRLARKEIPWDKRFAGSVPHKDGPPSSLPKERYPLARG